MNIQDKKAYGKYLADELELLFKDSKVKVKEAKEGVPVDTIGAVFSDSKVRMAIFGNPSAAQKIKERLLEEVVTPVLEQAGSIVLLKSDEKGTEQVFNSKNLSCKTQTLELKEVNVVTNLKETTSIEVSILKKGSK